MGKWKVDLLQTAFIVGGFAIVVALATAGWIVSVNSGSKSVVLGAGAVVGAISLFIIQLFFELRPSTSRDYISTDFTINRSEPGIRQWVYGTNSTWRIGAETEASKWLATNNQAAFNQDRGKLTLDFALYSLVSFLGRNEFDWQLRKVSYKGKAFGTLTTIERVSKSDECATFTSKDLKARLSQAGNLFGGKEVSINSGELCLPPRSSVEVTANSVVIRNPICQLSFNIALSGGIGHMEPNTGGQVPTLSNGEAQYETRPIGITVETHNFALRAQHKDAGKYREWCGRVIEGMREWFES